MKQIRNLCLLITVINFSVKVFGQEKYQPLRISHLTGDFYVYTTYNIVDGQLFPSNSLYVVTSQGVIMIDTPWDSTQFQPLLDSIERRHGKKVVLCIPTHYHADRTAGLEFLQQKGIKTYSSRLTKELSASHNDKQAEYTFANDTSFIVGNHRLQTYFPGEGHTKDNIIIWFDHEKILYGGCFLKSTENNSMGNIADANLQEWPVSIRKTMSRFPNPKYVIPGHFAWTSNLALKHTLDLLQQHNHAGVH